jgi:hypothetical protein
MLMKRSAIFFLFFICSIAARSQVNQDSCTLEISLLTVAPGNDLDALFGHTAIRVRDLSRGMDVVYNYGTFDDTDPLFYIHFMRGIMLYSLSADTFKGFMSEYEYEQRPVVAQVLNLTCKEKNKLYESLRQNSLEENRLYQYHFHTDNCTTRAAEVIESNTDEPLVYKNILSDPGPSYRDMIHEYLNRQHQYWSEFGIDALLGRHLDIKPTNVEAIHFLPDYLYRGMDGAFDGNKLLVLERKTIVSFPEAKKTTAWFTPMAVFTVLLLFAVCLFLFPNRSGFTSVLLIFDIIFFSLLGLVGILMACMWLGRIDDVCRNNMNILWALPTHIIAVLFIRKKAVWIKYYFLVTAILATLVLVGFPWWSQRMNLAVLPILLIIIFRSVHLFQNRNHAEKSFVQR